LPGLQFSASLSKYFHEIIFVLISLFALLAFAIGYRVHKNIKVLVIAAISLSLIGVSLILENYINVTLAHSINAIGSIALIIGHILNIKWQRQIGCKSERCHLEHDHPPVV
jgi:predicted tellurium resistance membrane protein TerC